MFSKELENLIEATLADGILEDHEKAALVKRAQKEGVDLDELEIYIQSIMQKRVQNQKIKMDKETAAHEKERIGNVCPHCHTQIPPMTKICPECGQAVNSNETSGDKELFKLIDRITDAIVEVKQSSDMEEFTSAKAECEGLLKKADLFYGENKKVQMLVFDLKQEIAETEKKLKSKANKAMAANAAGAAAGVAGSIGKKILYAFVLMGMFGLCCYIVPLFFDGYRDAMGRVWHKVVG